MNRVVRTALALAATTALVGVASAADFSPRVSYKGDHPDHTDLWTGCYVGLAGGLSAGQSRHTNSSGAPITPEFDISGGVLSGEVGCHYQVYNHWVLGFGADINGTNTRGEALNLPAFDEDTVSRTHFNWFSTQRAKFGWSYDRWLVYITGGLAVASIGITTVDSDGGSVGQSKTRLGYTVGAGVEGYWAPGWSAKLEYLFIDYGKTGYLNPPPDDFPDRGGGVTASTHIIRAGVNYHFNAPFWIQGF